MKVKVRWEIEVIANRDIVIKKCSKTYMIMAYEMHEMR